MRHVAWCSADLRGKLLVCPRNVEVDEAIGSSLSNDQGDDVALHRLGEVFQQGGDLEIVVLAVVDLQELDLEVEPVLFDLKVVVNPFKRLADEEEGADSQLLGSEQLINFSLLRNNLTVHLRLLSLP